MEPGVKLFQPLGGLASIPKKDYERENLRVLWTILPFPTSFMRRIPKPMRGEIKGFGPKLAPTREVVMFDWIGKIFEVPAVDWAFVRGVLQVDPEKRPTAAELLKHD